MVVHGDDFLSIGTDTDLDWLGDRLRSVYGAKHVGRIGPDTEDQKAMRVPNRVTEWRQDGIQIESDQRHAEIIVRALGLGKGKGLETPGSK